MTRVKPVVSAVTVIDSQPVSLIQGVALELPDERAIELVSAGLAVMDVPDSSPAARRSTKG